jgi:hypothetical protein
MACLAAILDAFVEYEELEARRDDARAKMKARKL